ncbi:MAG TPA: hypothetical protein VEC57_03635 [Candidatus Limnocylindrales bacterium]|nr:hypothetical protein [Candidatus Limnocylindrales bacterium]
MEKNALWKRTLASVLSASLVAAQVPTAGASASVYGTVKVAGPAWVAADSQEWSKVSSTRPLLAGDRIKTGDQGYVLADLGSQGTIGMYSGAEVRTTGTADAAVVGVEKGKVAFHVNEASPLQVAAGNAQVKATGAADGYVDTIQGRPTLTVESGTFQVAMASGKQIQVKAGERVWLDEPVKVAGAYGEPERPEELPAPPPPPAAEPVVEEEKKGMVAVWIIGGVALAAVAAVVLATTLDDDDDDDDNCASPPCDND